MKTFTTTLTLTLTNYVTRLEFWDLFRNTPRPTAEECNEPAMATYDMIMEYVYRRRQTGLDCGLPSLAQLEEGEAITTVPEWTRGRRYFTRANSGGNLYVADVRQPDKSLEDYRTDNHQAAFRLVVGQHALGAPETHKEAEYRARHQAHAAMVLRNSGIKVEEVSL